MLSRLRNNRKYPILFLASIIILLGINVLHYHKININDNVHSVSVPFDGKTLPIKDYKNDNLDFCYVQHLSSSLLDTSTGCVEVFQLKVLSDYFTGIIADVPEFYYSYSQLRAPPVNSAV